VETPKNSEVGMHDAVEKAPLPFDEAGETSLVPLTLRMARWRSRPLALSPADTAKDNAAEETRRLAEYAHAWGSTIPATCPPATPAEGDRSLDFVSEPLPDSVAAGSDTW
jgi:hypothetical protein